MSADNPTVNRSLADKAFDHLDHAIGRPVFPLRESYRNYFATDHAGDLAKSFDASPFWSLSGTDGRMAYYAVTQAGREALAAHLQVHDRTQAFVVRYRGRERIVAARSRNKAKYDYFLIVSDASDVTFVEFARSVRVRLAA